VANLDKARASLLPATYGLRPKEFVYVTLHRPSNVDDPAALPAIMAELSRLAARMPVVFPMHPRTRKMCGQFGIQLNGESELKILEPLGYHDSLWLTEKARLVLTDSGGLQEESTYFKTPCLTLRPNTERPVTITHGSNQLTTIETLDADICAVLNREVLSSQIPLFWDGRTAERILDALIERA
jgi:UDP-N-acetylglucosamine 2-epimerase (non-hydrolysing)